MGTLESTLWLRETQVWECHSKYFTNQFVNIAVQNPDKTLLIISTFEYILFTLILGMSDFVSYII